MGSLSITHWLIVLVIVALVFGTKKIRNLGSDLGGAIKGFKEGMQESERDAKDATVQTSQATQATPADAALDMQTRRPVSQQ